MTSGKRLLCVDDDASVLAVIQQVGTELGFEVEALASSTRFVETYMRVKPHVITLDIIMPDMDGIEIIQWLGDIESTSRVIILSGGGTTYTRYAKTLADAKGSLWATILAKPFRVADLRSALIAAAQSDPPPASAV